MNEKLKFVTLFILATIAKINKGEFPCQSPHLTLKIDLEVLVAPPRKNPFFIQKDGQIDTVIMPVDQFKAL